MLKPQHKVFQVMLVSLVMSVQCSDNKGKTAAKAFEVTAVSANQGLVLEKLSTYCGACHAIGKLNFLPDTSKEENWTLLLNEKVPDRNIVWREAIIAALSWESDAPPEFSTRRDDGERDWMPKGEKRLRLAEDMISPDQSARRLIIEELSR